MNWDQYVLDATLHDEGSPFCFVPIEFHEDGTHTLVLGMNYLSSKPPEGGKLVGVIHADGDEAVERWCEDHAEELEALSV